MVLDTAHTETEAVVNEVGFFDLTLFFGFWLLAFGFWLLAFGFGQFGGGSGCCLVCAGSGFLAGCACVWRVDGIATGRAGGLAASESEETVQPKRKNGKPADRW